MVCVAFVDDTWEIWNKLRLMCSHNPKLMLCLELTEDLPSAEELNRWLGEQVRSVIIPTRIFQSGGPRGTPKLPAVHEQFLFKLFHMRGVQYVLSGNSLLEGGSMAPYHFALLQLHRAAPKLTQQQMYEQSYWDVLQMPLQPLMDNLESSTYETFEYDQAKYENPFLPSPMY
jgi:type II protein arginine methyltransferase